MINHMIHYVCLIILLSGCNLNKKETVNTTQQNTHTKDLPNNPPKDSIQRLTIPPTQKFKGYKSDDLTIWIKTYLINDYQELDTTSAIALLKIVGITPLSKYRRETTGKFFKSTKNNDRYIIGITTQCESSDPIQLLFAIDKSENRMVGFETYFGRSCVGNISEDFGEPDGFESFGPYYAIHIYYGGWGKECMVAMVINDDLKTLDQIELVAFGGEDLGEDKYFQFEWGYEHSFVGDTMVRHFTVSTDNGTHKMNEELDIKYICTPDSFYCITPSKLKRRDELIEKVFER